MRWIMAGRWMVALAGAALAGSVALAQGPGGPGMRPGFGDHRPPFERAMGPEGRQGQWWNNLRMVDRLKLTDDQRKAMDGILQDHKVTLVDLHANLEKAELAMEPLMKADQPNEGAILAQIDKVAQARAELEKANARFLLALRSKLTPDQWKQMQTLHEERGRVGWGPGGRGPDGGNFHHGGSGGPPPAADGQPAPAPPSGGGPGDSE